MSVIYAQRSLVVWEYSASLAASAVSSGSAVCESGYAKLVGVLRTDATSTASGLHVYQSSDHGATWDYDSIYTMTACTASAFSIDVCGNAIKVSASNNVTAASNVRGYFALRPI
jgi:hypothetical protein